ncbi:short-chain dehydrogenase reductase sdr [Fusarium sporotrichioides]|uniref:Short-chain dehydrogenase reductase sdr n=1 Tax=Fusarium sporotrichioides TaxID=5514 RepID=A0A395S189_FUSSP|nr:short-chain dehydrogenase reductase sdr [Fusarium sporotrichioides]
MSATSPLRFDGRVAIVTGSGRGLGREYALLLSRLGAAVVTNSTTALTADSTAKEITDAGGRAIAHVGSVADRDIANSIVKAAIDNFGRIDIVINNAGGANGGEFDQAPDSNLWDMLNVHMGGSWNVTQAAWPHMKEQKFGRVIMTASPLIYGGAQQSAYGAAKSAVMGLANSIAIEGKQHNILVNTVAPMAHTPGSVAYITDEQTRTMMEASMPARDIAPTVAWLAHESSQVSGETLVVVSKLVMRVFLAETKGYFGPKEEVWTVESVRDNWAKIVDESEYAVPTDIAEYVPKIFQRVFTHQ